MKWQWNSDMYKRASTGSCPSDSKKEQQDMGVPMHSPSEGESFPGGSQEKGEIVGGARRKVSPQASQANFGQGSRPLPPHIKWWLSVCSHRLRGRYQPEQKAIESEEPSAPSLFCPQNRWDSYWNYWTFQNWSNCIKDTGLDKEYRIRYKLHCGKFMWKK